MNRWRAGLSLVAWMFCALLHAQDRNAQYGDNPPPRGVTRDGNVNPAFLEWDPGRYNPATQEHPSARVISARALAHTPPKAARKEFDRVALSTPQLVVR